MSLVGLLTATEKEVHLGQLLDEVHLVASEKSLVDARITRKSDPEISTLKLGAPRGKCPARAATLPTRPCSSDFYRCHKRRLGCSLR